METDVTAKYQYIINLIGAPPGGVTIWEMPYRGFPHALKAKELEELGGERLELIRAKGTKWHVFFNVEDCKEWAKEWGSSLQGAIELTLIHEISHGHATGEPPGLEFEEFAPNMARVQMKGLTNYLRWKPSAAPDLLAYIGERFEVEDTWPIPPRFKSFLRKLRAEIQSSVLLRLPKV